MIATRLAFLYFDDSPTPEEQAQLNLAKKKQARVEELNFCNDLDKIDETPAFESCNQLAESGDLAAQKKLAWLYYKEGTGENVQKSYNWLKIAGEQDKESQLLSYIMVFHRGKSLEDKERGQKGIESLANVGFAPAQAYLAVIYALEMNPIQKTAREIWLFERAFKSDFYMIPVFDFAKIYANGFNTKVNQDKAREILQEYAEKNFPSSANNVAWFLSTLSDNSLFNTEFAIELAKSVVDDPEFSDRFAFVDTLAAAYAADGQFDIAVETQTRAIELLKTSSEEDDSVLDEMESFQERLALYLDGKPYVRTSLKVQKEELFNSLREYFEHRLLNSHRRAVQEVLTDLSDSLAPTN